MLPVGRRRHLSRREPRKGEKAFSTQRRQGGCCTQGAGGCEGWEGEEDIGGLSLGMEPLPDLTGSRAGLGRFLGLKLCFVLPPGAYPALELCSRLIGPKMPEEEGKLGHGALSVCLCDFTAPFLLTNPFCTTCPLPPMPERLVLLSGGLAWHGGLWVWRVWHPRKPVFVEVIISTQV